MTFPFPYICPISAGGTASISFFNSSTSTTSSITAPASILAGDLLFILSRGTSASAPALVTPSGFTVIPNTNLTLFGSRTASFYKLATGTEGGTSLSVISATQMTSIMMVFRRSVAATTLTPSTWTGQFLSGTPSNQTVSGGTATLVVIGALYSSGGTLSMTDSPAFDATVVNGTVASVGYRLLNSGTTSDTISTTVTGSSYLASGYISMS